MEDIGDLRVNLMVFKSWSCFSTAFLNFLSILIPSLKALARSSRKLWENMAILASLLVLQIHTPQIRIRSADCRISSSLNLRFFWIYHGNYSQSHSPLITICVESILFSLRREKKKGPTLPENSHEFFRFPRAKVGMVINLKHFFSLGSWILKATCQYVFFFLFLLWWWGSVKNKLNPSSSCIV